MRNFLVIATTLILLNLSTLVAEAKEITRNDIEPRVKSFLVNHYKHLYSGDIHVECDRISGIPLEIPDGNMEIKITSNLRERFVQRTVVRVCIYVDGKFQKAFGVPVKLSLFEKVWVATQHIQRGDALGAVNVRAQLRDVSKLAGTESKVANDLLNTRATKTFRTGDILDHRFIEKEPIVIRNGLVEVIFKSDTVSVAIPCYALENGHKGDIIRVKSKEFNKEYIGKVIDNGTILVNI